MKENTIKSFVMFATLFATAGCTNSPGTLSSTADDLDGKSFSSKPGLARLYVIQGLEKQGDNAGSTVLAAGPAGSPMVAGAAAGALLGAAFNAMRDKPEAPMIPPDPADPDNKYPHVPIPIPNDVFINGKKIGTIGHLQYFALDLPPAQYNIKIVMSTTWRQPFANFQVDLSEGSVSYLLTTELAYWSAKKNERAIITCAPVDCQNYVLVSHRVGADWK